MTPIQIDAAVRLQQAVDVVRAYCADWEEEPTEGVDYNAGYAAALDAVIHRLNCELLRDHAAREQAECDECGNLPSYGHKGTCSFAATPIDITKTGVIIVDDQGARGYSAEQVRKALAREAKQPQNLSNDTPTQSGECEPVCVCGHAESLHIVGILKASNTGKGECVCGCHQYRDRARGGR
jgi:hypothetical protein